MPMEKPEAVGLSSVRLRRIRHVFQKEVDELRMPGVVIMISRHDSLVYSEAIGFRHAPAGSRMTQDTIFRILSLTKAFVTTATMMFVEDGEISLNDPVTGIFPAFTQMQVVSLQDNGAYIEQPAEREMTIQDLLRHTAGLDVPDFPTTPPQIRKAYLATEFIRERAPLGEYRHLSPEQQVAALSSVPLSSHPGDNWRYSVSTELLGRVLETVSGMRLSQLLAERLFRPLQMVDTGFFVPEQDWSRIAQPLDKDPTGQPMPSMIDVRTAMPSDSGAAGAVSTAGDYLTFSRMLLNGGTLDGIRYLSPTTVRLMCSDALGCRSTQPVSPSALVLGVEGYDFGLGFMIRGQAGLAAIPGTKGEYMWAGAGGTFFWNDPQESLSVVMMAQTPHPIRVKHRHLIKQLVAQAIEA